MDLATNDHGIGTALLVEHDQVGVVADRDRALAREPQQLGGIRRERRQRRFERQPASQRLAQRFEQRAGGADIHVRHATVGVETRQATAGVGADGDAIGRRARAR